MRWSEQTGAPATSLADTGAKSSVQSCRTRMRVKHVSLPSDCGRRSATSGKDTRAAKKGLVTISLGVGSHSTDDIDRAGATLLARADEALYVAKGAGRDRVTGWTNGRSQRWPAA